ncbi:hypothetical protein F4860DRAFT_520834 [Xylaria cubensis]|nr:hypothetical protein F4860DRAFT_520834 [Xylaria cubensis]
MEQVHISNELALGLVLVILIAFIFMSQEPLPPKSSLFEDQARRWDLNWVFDGYSRHSRLNSFFALPSIDRGVSLVVPPKQIQKVYGLPDTILDVHSTANDTIQTKWTIWDDEVSENDFQMNLIRNQLTRNLDILTPPIAIELEEGFRREWGLSTENWKSVDIWKSAMRIIEAPLTALSVGLNCVCPLLL